MEWEKDIIVSGLQKEIRRGHEKEAMFLALKLYEIDFKTLLRRLRTIALEDIADINVQIFVFQVCNWVEKNPYADLVWLGQVILRLCRARKSREADEFVNEVLRDMREGWEPEIQDYWLDQHTKKGRKMGRGPEYFWTEGAKLEGEVLPSKYKGYDPQKGDGYHYANGKKAPVPQPGLKKSSSQTAQEALF